MTEIVKIPAERIKILRGDNDSTKELIEKKCNVTLDIDPDGDVEIEGDPTDEFFAKDIVKAIGRGFSPNDALRLAGHDYNLYVIALKEIVGSEKAITRLKGRVIGEKGKIKAEIESATQSAVSVYGNTIGIISKIDTMEYAKEAISMILDGAPHTAVINYLAKARREIMESRLKG
jgi:ribosomal RNA assembly protein